MESGPLPANKLTVATKPISSLEGFSFADPELGDREIASAAKVAVHHHMLLGLQFNQSNLEGIDRKIAMKMSKSKPDTAIFMTDTESEVQRKFKKAHCVDGVIEDNPVLEYAKYIVFELMKELKVERPEQYGGNLSFKSYEDLEKAFSLGTLKSIDLKTSIAAAINTLLEPTRIHFSKGTSKKLLEQVQSFEVTR